VHIFNFILTIFLSIAVVAGENPVQIGDLCQKQLKSFSGKFDEKALSRYCAKMSILDDCQSVEGVPIYHYEKKGTHKAQQRILVFSLIHGDEAPAGSVVRFWLERLDGIDPRNSWRVVPVLNPDGVKLKTRDWQEKAKLFWTNDAKKNPRRFPGDLAASEPETKCALKHIEDFKPHMVVAIHTPLKVLDFDGPKIKPPKFDYLPWKTLGHYPGSLGRLMWFERKVPVITMEMKEDLPTSNQPFLELQDIIGYLVSLEIAPATQVKKKK
jgi:murein peptide amidase A